MENNLKINEDIQTSVGIKEIATALSKFQGEVSNVKKDSKNPFFNSKYAALDSIYDSIRKPLADNGLSFSQFPVGDSTLVSLLMHTSGQFIKSKVEMHPKDLSPQSHGSAITYMRRYCLSSILGIATEDDDDGTAAQPEKGKEPTKASKSTADAFAMASLEIDKAVTVEELDNVLKRIDSSVRLTIPQKDKLERIISDKILGITR